MKTGTNTLLKVILPLRECRLWLRNPKSQVIRYVKWFYFRYSSLSISDKTKYAHWLFLTKYFPWILNALNNPTIAKPLRFAAAVQKADVDDFVHDKCALKLNCSDKPAVSVIIPVYGNCDYTLRCLASIAFSPPYVPFEVIVIDDCSPDDSHSILSCIKDIKLLTNSSNQGFIRSCNSGAQAAFGEYLCFLNNDTEVTQGWLDELYGTFHEFPGTGLSGSKLVYPDGRLQEAGGIIWQDGSAWNFGHNQDQLRPDLNYAREVDYCSGASIMVPKALFEKLGGFDEHYLPAYCEDSDLALKIRENGLRVIYQPLSVVIHYEGVTSGRDVTKGVKSYQVENNKKLYNRWKERLWHHQKHGVDADNAKDRMARHRVLILDHCTPTPNQDAGSVTVFNLMLLLREMDFQVTFIPEGEYLYLPEYTPALQRAGIEVLYSPYCRYVEQHLKKTGKRYDLVFMFRPAVVEHHIKSIRKYCPKTKTLFHTVDLHYLRLSREADLHDDELKRKAAAEMKQRELTAIRAVDASIVHSTTEMEILRSELSHETVFVFPLILNIRSTKTGFGERRDLVFVGGFQHPPNVDAVKFFIKDIMPIVRERLPGVRFYAVGSKPPEELYTLQAADVVITGFVEDLDSLLDKMRISLAPLRYGAGIKGKIGTAMSAGLPTVATRMAAEGMSLTNGKNVLIADGTSDFAEAIVRLYGDETLWASLRDNGLAFAEKNWGACAAYEILNFILTNLGIDVPKTPRYSLRLFEGGKPDQHCLPFYDRVFIDGNQLKVRAEAFSNFLEKAKKRIGSSFPWYPYGTLNNFVHLEQCFNAFPLHRLTSTRHVADIGAADGDLAFFMSSLGYTVDIIDNGPTNYNGLEGARILAEALDAGSKVSIFERDIDGQFFLPNEKYDLIFLLGILYHLKNPYLILEAISKRSTHLILSTRVAKYTPAGKKISGSPVAYLLNPDESNNDSTNYWIFTEYCLERIVRRSGWDILYKHTVGDTKSSNPADPDKDERCFMLLRSSVL
ncbi:MAG TPA: glycosyltransferase [Desulfuromonadales bacterium]|nr:glycosyltransferase [Desulfuromonadales bacterium]